MKQKVGFGVPYQLCQVIRHLAIRNSYAVDRCGYMANAGIGAMVVYVLTRPMRGFGFSGWTWFFAGHTVFPFCVDSESEAFQLLCSTADFSAIGQSSAETHMGDLGTARAPN
jgi:hypothetical protein